MSITEARQIRRHVLNTKLGVIALTVLPTSLAFAIPQDDNISQPSEAVPVNLEQQLRAQVKAMKSFHIEFSQTTWTPNTMPVAKKFSVDFDSNRLYERIETIGDQTNIIERAFDGTVAYAGDPQQTVGGHPRKAMIMKYLVADTSDYDRRKNMFEFPYLNHAGYSVPEFLPDLDTFASVKPLPLFYLDGSDKLQVKTTQGVTEVSVITSDPILRVRQATEPDWVRESKGGEPAAKRKVTLLLDATYNYATTERDEWAMAGQRIVHIESRDFRFYKDADTWFPRLTVAWYYTNPYLLSEFSDQPVKVVTNELVVIDFKQHDSPFVLASTRAYRSTGTIVIDRTVPEARSSVDHQVIYTIAADGKQLRATAINVYLNTPFDFKHGFIMICVFIVLLALPPTLYLIKRL